MKIEKVFTLETILFQREEDSNWEKGLLVNEGERIYDMRGEQPNENLWDYKRVPGLCVSSLNKRIYDLDFDPKSGVMKLEVCV